MRDASGSTVTEAETAAEENVEVLPFSHQVEQAIFLIVMDTDSMRRITAKQLRQLGAQHILEARNGAEAAKLLTSTPVTVVLSDWNMPVMSGLELLLAVRAEPQLYALPFVMITAEAERERVQEAVSAGVSELLVKPYTTASFAERLESAMTRKVSRAVLPATSDVTSVTSVLSLVAASSIQPSAAIAATADKPTILVVDDTPDNLHVLAQIFKDDYYVKIAHNGEKALAICQSDTPPDLLLLDIMMPDLDGFQVAEKLRAHPSSEHIPIIFVTALNDEASHLRGITLGAVDFVSKPINPGTLKMRVVNFMRYVCLHRQLQANYDAMLETARLKEDIKQVISHDLKGPLAGVIGLTQDLLENGNLRFNQCDQLRVIEEAALQVMNMINRSSEIYKIETGRFQLHPQPVAVLQIVRRLAEMAEKTFSAKSLQLTVITSDGARDADLTASGDPMFCYSLLQNLLKNACEAAPDKTQVKIILDAGNALFITIENVGTVPAAVRSHFFEKFFTAGKEGGGGLGTYSAKLLTEAQGGSIAVKTSVARNTTRLSVTLPLHANG